MMFFITPMFNLGDELLVALTDSTIELSGFTSEDNKGASISKAIILSMAEDSKMNEEDRN